MTSSLPLRPHGHLQGGDRRLLHAAHNPVLALYAELTGALLREGLDVLVHALPMSAERTDEARAWAVAQCRRLVVLVEARDGPGAGAHWSCFLRRSGVAPDDAPVLLRVYGPQP